MAIILSIPFNLCLPLLPLTHFPLLNSDKRVSASIIDYAKFDGKIYFDSNMSLTILCILSMGSKDGDGSPILELTTLPWTGIKAKTKN